MLSKINPQMNSCTEIAMLAADTISDGNLGTVPVVKKSIRTGIPSITDNSRNIAARMPKKCSGLYSRKSLKMVNITLNPSEKVFSLLFEPSGLSLYSMGIFLLKKDGSNFKADDFRELLAVETLANQAALAKDAAKAAVKKTETKTVAKKTTAKKSTKATAKKVANKAAK